MLTRNLVVCVAFAALVGCATARVVTVQPKKGGVIGIHNGLGGDARVKAEELMRANCMGPFEITEEGEVVTGSVSSGSAQTSEPTKKGKYTTSTTSTSTSTQDTTEWRLTYKCTGSEKAEILPDLRDDDATQEAHLQ